MDTRRSYGCLRYGRALSLLASLLICAACSDDDGSVERDAATDAAGDDADADLRDASSSDASTDDDDAAADAGTDEDAAIAPCTGDCPAPGAGFTLSATEGTTPLWIGAESRASAGTEVRYDWGEGEGFVATASHRYRKAGTFTVTQRVRSGGGMATETAKVTVREFVPVRFSRTDKSESVLVSTDGYQVEHRGRSGGVRSDASIAPGSGVFYFEGRWLDVQTTRVAALGVATAAASLEQGAGADAQSMGISGYGPLGTTGGGTCTGASGWDTRFAEPGFVIDYRAATPTVHLVQVGDKTPLAVIATCKLTLTGPLFVHYWAERLDLGDEIRLNTGADTVNFPFGNTEADVRAALTTKGETAAAQALVMGFGKTRAPRKDSPPTLKVPSDLSVAFGQPVTLDATADDVEDGVLSAQIAWRDRASLHDKPVVGTGARFSFTPSAIGKHPIDVTVVDGDEVKTTKTVMVTVTGALPQANPVLLDTDDPLKGAGITVSPDKLSAGFTLNDKLGLRANQGLYGDFWYFEVHRNVPRHNMGIGVVVKEGSLNPYDYANPPWSASLNTSRGIWVNLLDGGGYRDDDSVADYGWAIDYRGEHPKAYVLVGNNVRATIDLKDIWTPVYPMIYGNNEGLMGVFDMTINFGATAFRLNPRAALTAAGVDATALKLGWGVHAK